MILLYHPFSYLLFEEHFRLSQCYISCHHQNSIHRYGFLAMKATVVYVYVCVCLWVNHSDVNRSGAKVDQGLPCVRHYIHRSSGKPLPLKRPMIFSKHSLSYGHQSRTFAEPVKEILYFEAAIRADRILRWIKSVEVLPERRMMAGS